MSTLDMFASLFGYFSGRRFRRSNASVSLPGVGGAEPTIIETLNKNTISNRTEEQLQQDKSENKEENQSVKEEKEQQVELTEEKTTEIQQNQIDDIEKQEEIKNKQNTNDNIFDIQSHLIETFDKNFSVSEDIDKSGVAVKEIPAKPEEFQRTSQIETETSPKSVIEIEPSIPKIHKPIQLELDLSSIKRESKLFDSLDKDDNNLLDTDNLNNNVHNVNSEEKTEVKEQEKQEDTAKEVKIEISNKFIEKENIESSHIENNNNILAKEEINLEFQNISDNSSKNKNDSEKLLEAEKQKAEEINIIIEDSLELNQNKNLDNITNIESIKVPEQSEGINNNQIESHYIEKTEEEIEVQKEEPQKTQESFRVPQNLIDTVENFVVIIQEREEIKPLNKNTESSPIDISNNSNIGRGINGLQNCTTPLEEEEKKKLLDSLPQLDENIDPHKLSIEAKKEYYQSLRDYLDKYQHDKPPVPLQTYRWEDLRRAKEKGGYPWTYLYKRPLGPAEEPEIVLLLRKSQEFNFHKHQNNHNHQASESPKSLKKVRIHDQVLVKETERYISDLSDTEDLSSKTSSPSSTGASTESEEDNKSALSESCVSDSVSEGKKSKFSKLKGILKRTECEEDNRSALSESCASDSVSEGKKSKFSKLKGILKRETGDKKKSKDLKQKESIKAKEFIKSKETSTLSSASSSPSPLPSDIPDSSDIASDEYQTPTTTESEGPSDHEHEEDNRSALSESCALDSVSEGKKSKFSKFKEILKRETGDKKKSQDNKQKELTEIKESTESKTTATLSSTSPSPSPLPSDTPNSSDIVSAEYKTPITTELEDPSNQKREEGNRSALSEPCQSDLESENKKSKFSKFKGILKREITDKIKPQDNKQKEVTEVKESTESKTTATSLSASPLPSDIPNTGDIISDEYQAPITTEFKDPSNQQREEDNRSAISESCAPDSVSEDKKSKFSKFKGILKRETDDKNKSQDSKQKDIIEVKESTESKTAETLSTASPSSSPLLSDIPNSSDIVSEEYQSTITELESPSDQEREEDNRSALSESCASDSISENKKSKFSKFKGILRRETGDKKKSQDHKQKEATEVPSDKSNSSGIVSDEYQTPITFELEDPSLQQREEDNRSALSESCASDSVSEGKKSKFNKFKGILNRETGDKKKSQDNKQKEPTEVPVPSDISNSSGIVSDEYQTPITFQLEDPSYQQREEDNRSALSESCASDSVSEGKKSKFNKFKGILNRQTGDKKKSQDNKQKEPTEVKESPESKETATLSSVSPSPLPSDIPNLSDIVSDEYQTPTTTELESLSEEPTPKKGKFCHPIMDKIKTMADKHIKKHNIKKISLKGDEKIVLEEEQKILKLRESPKADRGEIPKFVEKQDSEEIVEIVQLEESPSLKRKEGVEAASIVVPDEIIELPPQSTVKVQISQANVSDSQNIDTSDSPPKKTLRKMKDHVYEEIDPNIEISMKIDEILELASVEALKKSLAIQDQNIMKDVEINKKTLLDRMGSSEEDVEKSVVPTMATLAPISSIDSTSSDEQEKRILLSTVAEESDAASIDETNKAIKEPIETIAIIEEDKEIELKPVLKKEPSPGPNGADKKVTFSHVEDESEPLREDLETPEELKNVPNRWKDMT